MKNLILIITFMSVTIIAQNITNKLGGDTANETYDITDSNDNVLLRVQGDGGVKIGPTTNSGSLHVSGNVTAWSFATPGPIYDYWAESGTNGQILSSILNGNAVDWIDAPTNRVVYQLFSTPISITNTSYTNISYFVWDNSRYSSYSNGTLIYYIDTGPYAVPTQVRIYDTEASAVIAESVAQQTGIYTLDISSYPSTDTLVEIQVKKNNLTDDTLIFSAQLEFDN